MRRDHYRPWRRIRAVGGFSQMEIVASTALVGIVMVATMSSIAASRKRVAFELIRLQGQSLANELLTEILALPACDPEDGASTTLGLESGDSGGTGRTRWDDVDDYHRLTESPPQTREGADIPGISNWSREAIVERLKSDDWTKINSDYDNVYRVTVSTFRNGERVAIAIGLRNGDQRTNSPLRGP